jgi:hypothetical protein
MELVKENLVRIRVRRGSTQLKGIINRAKKVCEMDVQHQREPI